MPFQLFWFYPLTAAAVGLHRSFRLLSAPPSTISVRLEAAEGRSRLPAATIEEKQRESCAKIDAPWWVHMKATCRRFTRWFLPSVFAILPIVLTSTPASLAQSQSPSSGNAICPALLAKANSGDSYSQTAIGLAYAAGDGVQQDFGQAAEWFHKAAGHGDGMAEAMLGLLYQTGKGEPQDFAQAAHWYRKAAQQGIAKAQVALAILYREGKGVPQDDRQAVSWFRKAADKDDPEAEFNLARLYDTGAGVPQDSSKAVAWYRKAAEQGLPGAQINLGIDLFTHSGNRPKSVEEAYMWLNIAAAMAPGSAQQAAAKARDEVAGQLTPVELAQGKKQAEKWVTAHRSP